MEAANTAEERSSAYAGTGREVEDTTAEDSAIDTSNYKTIFGASRKVYARKQDCRQFFVFNETCSQLAARLVAALSMLYALARPFYYS